MMISSQNHHCRCSIFDAAIYFLLLSKVLSTFSFQHIDIALATKKTSRNNLRSLIYPNDPNTFRSSKIIHATSDDDDKRYDGFPVWFRIAEQKIAAYDNEAETNKPLTISDMMNMACEDDLVEESIPMDTTKINMSSDNKSETFAVQYPSKHGTMERSLSETTYSYSSCFSYVLPKGMKLTGLTIKADEEDEDVDNILNGNTKFTISEEMGYNIRIGM